MYLSEKYYFFKTQCFVTIPTVGVKIVLIAGFHRKDKLIIVEQFLFFFFDVANT